MIKKLRDKIVLRYKLFVDSLYREFIDDEIDNWIHDYWSDLYNEYIGD